MTTATARRGGNRRALPDNALKVCASCERPRGNSRRAWVPIMSAHGQVLGWTCDTCPRVDEPIRQIKSARGIRWRVVLDATPPGAVKRRQVTRTCATLAEARAVVEEIRAEVLHQGQFVPAKVETLAALCERWLASRVDIRAITVEGYRGSLAPVVRYLGHREVPSLTTADMRDLVTWLSASGGRPTALAPEGRSLAPRSVRAALVALKQALDLAMSDGAVTVNVTQGVKLPRQGRKVGTDLQHWQPDALRAFREHADSDPLAGAWRLTLSGLTRADVLGLRWTDVDLDAGTIQVAQGRVQLHDGGQRSAVDEPKSEQRRRTVPVEVLHPGSMPLLRTLKAAQAADRLAAGGAYTESGLVVVDALGHGVRPEGYSDQFRRLCVAAGVPLIRLHSVRHSLAFGLHQAGVSAADSAALLGHTVEVFLSTYLPDSGSAGIASAAAALGRAWAAEA